MQNSNNKKGTDWLTFRLNIANVWLHSEKNNMQLQQDAQNSSLKQKRLPAYPKCLKTVERVHTKIFSNVAYTLYHITHAADVLIVSRKTGPSSNILVVKIFSKMLPSRFKN